MQTNSFVARPLAWSSRMALLLAVGAIVVAGMLFPSPAHAAASPTYYVSLGDSYSVGYQPGPNGAAGTSTPGYTVYTAKRLNMTLANFGCGGATTTSIISTIGCPDVLKNTVGLQKYPTTTQIAAADSFIKSHKGHIGLITVSIGGNDVTACASSSNPIPCVGTATSNITTNVSALASDLRAAAGPNVQIIGLTYPDVILGSYVYPTNPGGASAISLAQLSVVAFKSLINPALSAAYTQAGGSFVDVTAATGAYTPLTNVVKTKTFGTIPVPVASVCALTWFCNQGNIHAKTPGYTLEGQLIVKQYKKAKK